MAQIVSRFRCPVSGCDVVIVKIAHALSGIGDHHVHHQHEFVSNNSFACSKPEQSLCACKRYDIE